MLEAMGYPAGPARMQRDMYAPFANYVRIAVAYGDPMLVECGMGQGCSLSLIAANAAVANEFLMLQHRRPEVETIAFIDDRTLDTDNVQQLEHATSECVKMDELMGHTTNVDKSTALATTRRTRKKAGQTAI